MRRMGKFGTPPGFRYINRTVRNRSEPLLQVHDPQLKFVDSGHIQHDLLGSPKTRIFSHLVDFGTAPTTACTNSSDTDSWPGPVRTRPNL